MARKYAIEKAIETRDLNEAYKKIQKNFKTSFERSEQKKLFEKQKEEKLRLLNRKKKILEKKKKQDRVLDELFDYNLSGAAKDKESKSKDESGLGGLEDLVGGSSDDDASPCMPSKMEEVETGTELDQNHENYREQL